MKLLDIFKNIKDRAKDMEFLPTGLKKLDDFLDGGFMRKELIILGGFTGSGKSYLAGQFAFSIARQGFKTSYFSLEISNEMIASRLIGQKANIKPARLVSGLLTAQEYDEKILAEDELSAFNELIEYHDSLYQLKEITEQIKKDSPEFVVIDFIQNIISRGEDEYSRLSSVALELQKLAKEVNCCILVLSQLSNSAAKNTGGQVEYKGSGSIATVADIGFYIEQIEIAPGAIYQPMKLIIKKNRRGYSGGFVDLKMVYPGGLIKENDYPPNAIV